ncbi:hypothetical protein IQ07DRAFT_206418 [Pyrenochaeta sp. DS3sAY3a]|nr:hypothetical protein IQ07DRAFT_206418 [Pyrenochaeta sp. DS3sAY3a]
MKRQTRLGAAYDNMAICTAGSLIFLVLAPIALISKCLGKAKHTKEAKETESELLVPKVVRRQRSLTDVSIQNLQLESRFTQLPGELRNRVYAELFGTSLDIHIIVKSGFVLSLDCMRAITGSPEEHRWAHCYLHDFNQPFQRGRKCYGIGALGLLRSCRLMYAAT